MNAEAAKRPVSRRRWYQFSLRTFLIGVATLSVLASIGGYWAERHVIRARLSALGVEPASIAYSDGRTEYGVGITGLEVDDHALARIVPLLPRSKYTTKNVILTHVNVSPRGLKSLESLTDLKCVVVERCPKMNEANIDQSDFSFELKFIK